MKHMDKRLIKLEESLKILAAKADPSLCSYCGTDCKIFAQEWYEKTGEEVYDSCMNRHVVLHGDGLVLK